MYFGVLELNLAKRGAFERRPVYKNLLAEDRPPLKHISKDCDLGRIVLRLQETLGLVAFCGGKAGIRIVCGVMNSVVRFRIGRKGGGGFPALGCA